MNALRAEHAALTARLRQQHACPGGIEPPKPPRPKPKPYDGNSKGLDAFVRGVELWTWGVSDPQHRITLIASVLTGNALSWHSAHHAHFATAEDYMAAFCSAHEEKRRHENAVRQLRQVVQQGKSVYAYNRTFNTIVRKLHPERALPTAALVDFYLDGLRDDVRAFVEPSGKPADLQAAMASALLIGSERAKPPPPPPPPPQSRQQRQQQQQRGQHSSGPPPMEGGSVQQGKASQQHRAGSGSKPWPPPHPPSRPCPICSEHGHWKVDCPKAILQAPAPAEQQAAAAAADAEAGAEAAAAAEAAEAASSSASAAAPAAGGAVGAAAATTTTNSSSSSSSSSSARRCDACGTTGAPELKRCARCRAVRYCSAACQKAHWRAGHKAQCVPMS